MMNREDKMVYPIILTGEVVHGKGLGRTVGMPTANLHISDGELPKAGVYAGRLKVGNKVYCSVTNIGQRPSVDQEQQITVESFILDFHADIYGCEVELELLKYLRPVRKFSDLGAVSRQVKKDIEEAKKYL